MSGNWMLMNRDRLKETLNHQFKYWGLYTLSVIILVTPSILIAVGLSGLASATISAIHSSTTLVPSAAFATALLYTFESQSDY